ncbi:MAG TPA: aconitase/3-isopropylmalate dehydratase large subunit family protein [Anaerolineales bacterium]|nr:aconitase/3-isopropylmalate dehydratase large subunit family protein [Anaerolineales bacterium]
MAALTFAEKALARAAGVAEAHAGDILIARPDRILSHDNTAAIAHIFYDELGAKRVVDPERLCVVLDHASPPPTPKHAQNHAETRKFVQAQGIRHFFEVGRGICHQVISEEGLVLPGDLILGADSHTTHYGWLGAFGAGVGRSEVAALWDTGRLWLRVPESLRINLSGELPTGVTAKDLCLQVSKTLGADGGLYYSLEFSGPGVGSLSLESRMVIPNTMAEIGVKNAYLPPDEAVFDYLARRSGLPRRQIESQAIYPDEGATYAAEYDLALDRLEPLVACPHSVDNVQPLSAVAGQHVDMAFIGTCTNGRLEDLAAAAQVLRGQHVHPGTRLLVIPASNQVYQEAMHQGYLDIFIESGATIGVPGCGPCMGNHLGIPAAGEVVISSANRNFKGRMGQPDASIYLAAPSVVAASAIAGKISAPGGLKAYNAPARPAMLLKDQKLGKNAPVNHNDRLVTTEHILESNFNAGQFVASNRQDMDIRQENSQPSGKVWKYGHNVNTDQIFPGKYTYTVTAPEEIGAHALEDLDPLFANYVRPGDVVFGGNNFGCGSSREQAVTCLKYKGVGALVAGSFARIFYRNAINQGVPAIICPEAVAAARPGDPVQVDLANGLIRLPSGDFAFPAFPPNVRAILEAGGLVEYTKKARLKVEK